MRYEDASQSGSSISENPVARDDADSLPAGDRGPATGNVISGSGTQTGASGADLNAEAAHIVSINGAHGSDSSFSGGKLVADGQFGRISIDREGNYSYLANKGAPESSRDNFTYKLADARGHSDSATLTIEIGKTPTVVQANAQRVVPGPDGVVVLPAGVELSDIHVVGRNLVIDLPDGRQMLIIDGAVFVPQLVLGDVEVPATSLAALLIGSELRPAAGDEAGQLLSSGGNFEVPVGPLDPGVPLGDLIPPTELAYVPPEFREALIDEDDEPEILIQTPDQPAGVEDATARVFEEALAARPGEPAGSNSSSTAETTTGTIVYDSNDTPNTLTVNGVVITAVGQVIGGTYGAITITSIADGAIGYSYTLADNTSGDATSDLFTVVITDSDGDTDTATLTVSIVDDVPTARADVDSVREDGPLVANGNVLTGSGGNDANTTDGVADTPGADGITVTGIAFGSTAGSVGSSLPGTYGSLVLSSGGGYVYTLNNGSAAVQALGVNETLTETFTYTITDGDGDVRSTTLTITINGANDAPTIIAAAAVVSEEGLAAGNPDSVGLPTDTSNSATTTGQLTIGDVDGDALTVTLGTPAGSLTSHGQPISWSLSSDGHVLTGSAGGAAVITVAVANSGSYTVTLLGQVDHPNPGGEDVLAISVPISLSDGVVTVGSTLIVSVEDDSPRITTAAAVTSSVLIDETDGASPLSSGAPLVVTSAGAIITTGISFGADGPGTATVYSLSLQGGGTSIASGLQTALGDQPITLTATSATLITATYNGGTQTAFTIQMNANGTITVTQFTALEHAVDGSTAAAYDDALNLVLGDVSLVNANATYTDFDGDRVTATAGIGGAITFRDDGPSIDVTANAAIEAAVLLTTGDDGTEGAGSTSASTTSGNFGGAFGLTFDGGADGAATPGLSFTLNATTAVSGLTSHGAAINLYNVGGVIVGSTAGTAPASATDVSVVFAVSVGATGVVTLAQYAQIDHPLQAGSNDAPFADQLATLADGAITLTALSTILDNDGDSASDSATINIGANLRFADDGPDIAATLVQGATIRVDETDGVPAAGGEVDPLGGDLGTVTVAAASLFTVATVAPSADTPTSLSYALAISAPGVASGLLLSTTNEAIVLVNNGGVIEGHVANPTGAIAFTVSIDAASGATTLTQYLAVEHFDPTSNDEDSSGLTAGVLSVVVTATDYDGDTDVASADLGSIIRFEDDGPVAVDDTDSIASAAYGPATGNVITDAEGDGGRDNVGADNAVVVGVAVGGADVPLVDANTVGLVVQGTYGKLTLGTDGTYSYVRDPGTDGGVSDVFTYTLRDGDGDFATAQLTITIGDSGTSLDVPTQGEAGTLVDEAGLPTRNGNLPNEPAGTGEAADLNGTNDSDQSERTAGVITFTAPDGPGIVTIDGVVVTGTIGQTFTGSSGVLTITGYNAGGTVNYTYVLGDNTSGDATFDDFVVRVTDQDGDFSESTLTIDIVDDEPLAVDDTDSVASGSFVPATGNVITDAEGDGGRDNVGADNAAVVGVAVGGADVPLVDASTVGLVVQGTYGKLTLGTDGTYSYVRDAGTPGGVSDVFTYTLRDGDGDFATAQLTISIGNATPQATTPAPVWLDDDTLTNGNPGGTGDRSPDLQNATGTLTGTGGDGDLDFFFSASQALPAGYSIDPTSTATTLKILQGTTLVITVTLDNETGAYTVTQNAPIVHATGLNENESPDINVSFFTRDVDGSVSAPANLTISVDDDSAIIVAASNINIQNSGDVAAAGTFVYSLGADGAPANNNVFSLVTGSATVNGVAVTNYTISETSESATSAVYTFSFDYPAGSLTVHETGTLTFDKSNGTYTVDLTAPIAGVALIDTAGAPASAFVNYNANGTISNGPSEIATVRLSSDLFIQFTGDAEPGSGTGANNLTTTQGTGGTFTPTVGTFGNLELFTQAAATVTVSSSAAGVAGNTIQGGEVLDFNLYATNPLGNTSGVPTASATSMFIELDGIGGAEDFIIVLKLYDTVLGTYTTQALMVQNGDIITTNAALAGTIYSGIGLDSNDGLVVIEANDYQNGNTNLVIVGAQIAGSDEGIIGLATNFNGGIGASGGSSALVTQPFSTDVSDAPFKIQNIGFVTQSIAAQTAQLTFNVTVQDSDGDTATQTLVASVTANPDSSTPLVITPVALDTNHDGVISYLGTDAGVTFDYAGDGSAESTAWVGAGDSILVRDGNGDGTVSGASEFVFGNGGQTDLQALHAQYGDQLDASDADFVQFMVWNDANSNGIADAGELTSLADAGIVSLNLVSDGIVSSAADGDVAIAGSGSFAYVNDNGEARNGLLADVAFRTVDREIEQAQRVGSAANSAAIVTAAVAAVGLAASQAAAHGHDQPVGHLDVAAQAGLGAGPVAIAASVDAPPIGSSLLGNEERLVAHEPVSANHGLAQPLSHELTLNVSHAGEAHDMAGLLAPSESPAQDALSASPMAAMIVIPSIEGFAAADAAHDVGAQRGAAIENVLAEALQGGAGGGDIDAILASLPNLGGGNPALEALASQHGAGVSGWDMGPDAHLSADFMTNIVMDVNTFHHDAVQPAING